MYRPPKLTLNFPAIVLARLLTMLVWWWLGCLWIGYTVNVKTGRQPAILVQQEVITDQARRIRRWCKTQRLRRLTQTLSKSPGSVVRCKGDTFSRRAKLPSLSGDRRSRSDSGSGLITCNPRVSVSSV